MELNVAFRQYIATLGTALRRGIGQRGDNLKFTRKLVAALWQFVRDIAEATAREVCVIAPLPTAYSHRPKR